jgi:hypothetical protein
MNWGVVLLPIWWTLGERLWLWASAQMGMLIGWLYLLRYMRLTWGVALDSPRLLIPGLLSMVLSWSLCLWFAANGNARVWRREARATERGGRASSVTAYIGRQRIWVQAGIAWLVVGELALIWQFVEAPSQFVGGRSGAALSLAVTGAGLLIAFALDRRMVRTHSSRA